MVNTFGKIQTAIQYKNSGNLGDFAILKADALGAKVDPMVESKLQSVIGYHPPIDLHQLSHYPEGSFGRVYADHMRANQLAPFNISPELEEVAQRNVFALRYVVTHDMFHVLLGFDTSYAGEMGVLAFAAAQGYSKALKLSLGFARLLYPMLAPQQLKAIFTNLHRGQALGQQAEFLLGYRFEDHWEEPINRVRAQLKLPELCPAQTSGGKR